MNLKPLRPRDVASRDPDLDRSGGYSVQQLQRIVRDCESQPDWRSRADLNVAYYDGRQLTEEQEHEIQLNGMEPRVTNLIGRVINGVLGQEARSRSDVRVEADDGDLGDVTDVLNQQLKEAQRETYADMAVSMGYGQQVKAGIGWVEISRNGDPLDYPYRVAEVERNEIWWDWHAKDFLLRDARWIVRAKWYDLDELEAMFPKHREVLTMMANAWEGWADVDWLGDQDGSGHSNLSRAFENYRQFTVRATEWLDAVRKRVKLYEVWYKVPASAVVMHLSPTRRVLYDESNALHVQAVERGLVKLTRTNLTRQVRRSLFAGPYRIDDKGTTRRHFPYVPFLAFRDDLDKSPYGLIDGMRSPQDEYNERRQRIQWLLKARQVWVDNDALDPEYNNFLDLGNNVMRPDMLLVLDANRRNADAVKVANNLSLQKEQVEVMQDAKQLIQDVSGVYSTQLGDAPTGVTSGVAITGLVEQGLIAMGELNDNYKHSRRLVFEQLLDLIVEDHSTADLKVSIGEGRSRRVVVLNTFGKDGAPMNMVGDAPVRVGISEVPASPAARMQQQQQLATVIGALAGVPQAVAALAPAFVEASALDAETRRQAAKDLRKALGMPDAEDRQAMQEAEQAAQQAAAQQQQLMQAGAEAEVAKKAAEVRKTEAAARLDKAREDEIRARLAGMADPEAAAEEAEINDIIASAV